MRNLRSWEEFWEDRQKFIVMSEGWFLDRLNKMTPIERIVCVALRDLQQSFGDNNLRVIPQKKIGKYTVDFELEYKPLHASHVVKKIIVECDGHDFHEKTKEQVAKGKKRDRFLSKQGYTVLHYSGSEILRNWTQIYRDIEEMFLPDEVKEWYGYGEINCSN